MKILVAGDDPATARTLQRGLIKHGHDVLVTPDGLEVLRAGADVCVLDLPELESESVLERARANGVVTPALVLTKPDRNRTRRRRDDAVDYLAKPFTFADALTHLDRLVKRQPVKTHLGALELDLVAGRARIAGAPLALSKKQFGLLAFFVAHAGEVVTRPDVLKSVFGYDFDPGTNIVDVHVATLRRKLAAGNALRIATIRTRGYRLEEVALH